MLDRFIFENHLGQRFDGLSNGVYLNSNDLRNYSWNYDTINSRISRFYRSVKGRKLSLVICCNSDAEAVAVKNRLMELAEADIEAKIPGKIFVGDYYTSGYITDSKKTNYLITGRYCKVDLTLTSDDPAWYHETIHEFTSDAPTARKPIQSMTIYGKSTQNGIPTHSSPVEIASIADNGILTIKSVGKNLAPVYPSYANVTNRYNATITDGTVTFNNLNTSNTWINAMIQLVLPAGTYTLSCDVSTTGNAAGIMGMWKATGAVLASKTGTGAVSCTFTLTEATNVNMRFHYSGNTAVTAGSTATYANIQLELGSERTAYVPYDGSTANVTTGLPLRGIPVSSGGNVTINGQMYVSDVLEKLPEGTWRILKYTGEIDSYNAETVTGAYLSTTGALTTGASVIYALPSPTIISITAAEVSALEALQTYKPVTHIYTDADAHMSMEYLSQTGIINTISGSVLSVYDLYVLPEAAGPVFTVGIDYPYDFAHDYCLSSKGRNIVCNSIGSNAFKIIIYGEATNPFIVIGGHTYTVYGTVGAGETLEINSLTKTITLTTATGGKINWYDKRGRENYIFTPIPSGMHQVSWVGTFNFDLTVIEKRSEPRWT